jgi:hypothetical protein
MRHIPDRAARRIFRRVGYGYRLMTLRYLPCGRRGAIGLLSTTTTVRRSLYYEEEPGQRSAALVGRSRRSEIGGPCRTLTRSLPHRLDLLRREPIAAAHHAATFDIFLIGKVA